MLAQRVPDAVQHRHLPRQRLQPAQHTSGLHALRPAPFSSSAKLTNDMQRASPSFKALMRSATHGGLFLIR